MSEWVQEALTTISEEDLMALGSDAHIEVIEGKVIPISPVNGLHHFIAGNIHRLLDRYVEPRGTGYVMMDGLIYLLNKVGGGIRGARVPDVSYIRKRDIPKDWNIERPYPGAPTLAVEVMSPDDKFDDAVVRVREYLAAGSDEVWVVLPVSRQVYQYRQSEPNRIYVAAQDTAEHARIDTDSLFPGLNPALSDIFTLPSLHDE
ncbi:MAG: Uma2 family endonuclease [bacterium]|nr:Uma2 family endonuclease [bacterium]